jgi:hypothetical protein
MLAALLCSQATLLSRSGVVAMTASEWYARTDALLLWAVILICGSCMAGGITLDIRWSKIEIRGDEHFLVVDEDRWQEEERRKEASPEEKKGIFAKMCEAVEPFLEKIREFRRDWGEVGLARALKTLLRKGVAVIHVQVLHMQACARLFMADKDMKELTSLAKNSNKAKKHAEKERQAAATLPPETNSLFPVINEEQAAAAAADAAENEEEPVMEQDFDQQPQENQELTTAGEDPAAPLRTSSSRSTTQEQATPAPRTIPASQGLATPAPEVQAPSTLRSSHTAMFLHPKQMLAAQTKPIDRHKDKVTGHIYHTYLNEYDRCVKWPVMLWRVFSSKCPWLKVLRYSIYMPASMSMLLFECQVFGQMFIVALFFQASGGALSKDADPICIPGSIWEVIGRTIMVGIVSSTCSALPPIILGLLHSRDFQLFPAEDAPERVAMLKRWKRKDTVMWVLGAVYVLWGIFFSCLFLANVTERDGLQWLIAVGTGLLKKALLTPLFVSAGLLFLVICSMDDPEIRRLMGRHVASLHAGAGAKDGDLLREDSDDSNDSVKDQEVPNQNCVIWNQPADDYSTVGCCVVTVEPDKDPERSQGDCSKCCVM